MGKAEPRPVELSSAELDQLISLSNTGHYAELENRTNSLVGRHPNCGIAWKLLGESLYMQNKDALHALRKATELLQDDADAFNNLSVVLTNQGQLNEAVSCCRRALEIRPDDFRAHNNLGNALNDLEQFDRAVTSYSRALKIKPDNAKAHNNLGTALLKLGRVEDATASYRRALQIKPDYADASSNLALALLFLGQYSEAWPLYETRYDPNKIEPLAFPPAVTFPQWQGESLAGKSLLIWPEQGLGDEIQFIRYIPMLKDRGVSHLTLVCKQPLKALFEEVQGVDKVISLSDITPLPYHDYWTFILSLPLNFKTTVETIPAKLPYLNVPSARLNRWREQLPKSGLKVGLVWKGNASHKNDHNRSLPGLATLAPLWSVPGVAFVSLQKGQGEDEAATPPDDQPILNLGSDVSDFADTAAIVDQLDLVICIDSAVAHLVGALSKPCWVLLPATNTDWRWFQERADSPWYPGVMRLFRQKKTGDWSATIIEVAQALTNWIGQNGKSGFK
jgi:Flp pilus assembly protein TadD